MAARIATFDDWVDLFREWQKAIGVDLPEITGYQFEAKYGELKTMQIEFGDYRGRCKWERVIQIPDQRIRDALQNLIVYQGDTEFASVEQQRHLFEAAPSDYDRQALARVVTEEMRHGWQMCHLLIQHFGSGGKLEAQKQLERRAFENKRLLSAFNDPVQNWLDFYTYTDFVDRDGKFQLTMLSYSGFAPLASSMIPMLKEESFHLGTGQDGLRRLLQAGRIPPAIVQKYINKWIPAAYDLFGVDHSTSAHWFYVWGLKGRYDEHQASAAADKERLNEHSRELYRQECERLIGQLNRLIPDEQPKLYVPDLKFNRRIGDYAHQPYSVTGERLAAEDYEKHRQQVLPSEGDLATLKAIFAEGDWVESKKATTQAQ
ncbi:MAG: phenylacetate-CoA oxygenase subunit PaaI [Acidobacteria bacterium]|nr:phenylacetate-CoA oxygenase subunit PaaI [Acidobacteriota bacterium]